MPNGAASSKRRFRLILPQKNPFRRSSKFRVRVRNGAPAQDFLKTKVRNPSGSSSKWRSRPGLPQKQHSEPFGSDFQLALPSRTSSKTKFETLLVRFRNSAPAQDFLGTRTPSPASVLAWFGVAQVKTQKGSKLS